jgi:hypothetical protein
MREPRDLRGVRLAGFALLLAGTLGGAFPPSAAASPRGGPAWRPASSLLYPVYFGVAATSASNVWAVGQYQSGTVNRTLIAHWNGTAWRQVPSPNPDPAGDTLSAVAATSAASAWAVGEANGHTLILRWNGTTWRRVAAPDGGNMASVAATSATSAWAVGIGGPGGSQTSIEHWNGRAWQLVRSPVTIGQLDGVAATSATSAWAVGFSGNWQTSHALVLHWNGRAWAQVRSPDPAGSGNLYSVAATSAASAWAVSGAAQQAIGVNATVTDHWDGRAWTRVPSANPVPGGAILMGVAAYSATGAWAVGTDTDFAYSWENTIEHWNGRTWAVVPSPVQDGSLYAVTAISAASAWAVGSGDSGALILHWNGTRWTGVTFP